MAARLTDRKKKKIIADYLETESYNATAKKNGVCGQTVRRVVQESNGITENLKKKKRKFSDNISINITKTHLSTTRNILMLLVMKSQRWLKASQMLLVNFTDQTMKTKKFWERLEISAALFQANMAFIF